MTAPAASSRRTGDRAGAPRRGAGLAAAGCVASTRGSPRSFRRRGAPLELLQFPNGSANLTYLLRFGGRELVLRRPPFGEIAPGAHDMKREFKVLSRLWRHFDRAPRALPLLRRPRRARRRLLRDGAPPRRGRARRDPAADGAPSRRRPAHRLRPRRRHGRSAPARPGGVRASADLGRPDGLRRAPGRRAGPSAGSSSAPDDATAGDGRSPRARWRARVPARRAARRSSTTTSSSTTASSTPADPDRVPSIFDWDMTTLGDPLVDLGTLLNYWPDPGGHRRDASAAATGACPHGPADPRGDHRALRRAHRRRRGGRRAGGRRSRSGRRWWSSSSSTAAGCAGRATDPRMAHIADRMPALIAGRPDRAGYRRRVAAGL